MSPVCRQNNETDFKTSEKEKLRQLSLTGFWQRVCEILRLKEWARCNRQPPDTTLAARKHEFKCK